MTKKIRLTILLICVVCFFVIAPILVLYSMGDRFDFKKMEITATGGIYVRTFPAAEKIIIDSKIIEKPGIFSNSIFVQSLLPSEHTVLIKKNGYYDYSKNIPVQENQVTKLENILLIKKNIQFEVITDKTQSPFDNQEKFIIKNNNLYYSDAPGNASISAAQKSTAVLKGLVGFSIVDNNIIWLGTDGFLYQSDSANLTAKVSKITSEALKINKKNSYKILLPEGYPSPDIFVIGNNSLLSFNAKTDSFYDFYTPAKDAKISPDGKNIIYYNDNNIYISLLPTAQEAPSAQRNTLYKSSEKINDCLWLNNNYIIFTIGNKIIISETDYRGNINTVTFPQTMIIPPYKKIDIKNPQIFFNQQNGKLYILTNNILLSSEKITP